MSGTIERLAERFGITAEDVATIVVTMDTERGMLGPEDMSRGLAIVVKTYVDALSSAAARFEDPDERVIADRTVSLAIELLAGQLGAAAVTSN